MMPDRVRAFVAIRMAPEVEHAVVDFIASMRTIGKSDLNAIRWIGHANLHVTLRFLGDRVAGPTLDRLDGALGEIATATTCFALEVRGIGVFPNPARPRVVWVGMESSNLRTLAAQIEGAAVGAGLAPERGFTPHLTIGRIRDLTEWKELRRAIEAAQDRKFGWTRVKSLILYRSILGRDSPTYEEVGHYPFADGAQ
jgi:2'-5' RNA ligase